ncbi:MAG: serine/threonine-protein kinase [Acidobacteriota bacterium]|nr:serine/threonine-protein kinase [Acidobacteriota bacterium]
MIGRNLSQYRITASIGAGGMGEVYRATDSRLGRDVAIKVLPAATASDPDRRKRFEQEARAASALNHPNILTVYDIGETDGTIFIAMELVEGRTLRELLAGGEPVPTKRLLEIAVQTAEGLAKAHSAGIVHRDLKPENLMLSKDGFVKILDFGLAKLTETVMTDATGLPTVVATATQPGTVMGTAGYMSPEQASGHPVDFHSDQFTLGTILYEMATGKRAFQRKTGAETLVAIIREEPESLGQLAPSAPAPVRWIVERLLAKDPEERYASTKDLARDLKSVRDHLSETSASGGLEAAEPAKVRRRGWALPAAAALAAGIAAGFLLRAATAPKPGGANIRKLTYNRGSIATARFAPDNQTIVYSASWDGLPLDVFTTRSESAESRSLGLAGTSLLAVSSGGEMAVSLNRKFMFGFETTGTLARVPLAGGAPREILENVQDADWSPDGKELAVARHVGNRNRLDYPIGKVLYDASGWLSDVRVSPDGRLVAFIDHPLRGDNTGVVKVVDTSGKILVAGPPALSGLAWSPSGGEVWSSERDGISATSLSGKTRVIWNVPGGFLQDIARDGRVLCGLNSSRREIVGVSGDDKSERNLTWLNWSFPKGISADGKTVLFEEQNVVPSAVYLRKLDGSAAVRMGDGGTWGFSPDGRWVLTIRRDAKGTPIVLLPTGAGEARPMPRSDIFAGAATWFPDGRRILISGNEPGHGSRLFVQDVEGGKPRPITPEGVNIRFDVISPDGKSVVATGTDQKIDLYPIEPGEPRAVPGMEPNDVTLRWTPDGNSIFVYHPSAPPLRVEKVDVKTGQRTLWKEIRPPDPSGVEQVGPIQIAPDEKSYVYSYRRSLDELYLATGMK